MPTVVNAASIQAAATQAFNQRKLHDCQNGNLWDLFRGDAGNANNLKLSYSTGSGATWSAVQDVLSGANVVEGDNASLFIDLDDYAHVVWKDSGTTGLTSGYVYYMRGTPNAGRTAWTWSAAQDISGSASPSADIDYPDVWAQREGTGWAAHVVASASATATATNGVLYNRVAITSGGAFTLGAGGGLTTGAIYLTNNPQNYGSSHTYPSIDGNHTGDGKTVAGGTPHLYVGWSAGTTGAGKGIRFRKAVYSAGAWTWNAEREINPDRFTTGQSWMTTHFDGTRVSMVGRFSGVSDITLYERDAADTTTTTTTLVANASISANEMLAGSASYDSAGNLYLVGRDSSGASGTRLLRSRKWTRATATLGALTTFDSTGLDEPYMTMMRGYGGSAIRWVYTDGTASPYSVTFDKIDLPPATPYVPAVLL